MLKKCKITVCVFFPPRNPHGIFRSKPLPSHPQVTKSDSQQPLATVETVMVQLDASLSKAVPLTCSDWAAESSWDTNTTKIGMQCIIGILLSILFPACYSFFPQHDVFLFLSDFWEWKLSQIKPELHP